MLAVGGEKLVPAHVEYRSETERLIWPRPYEVPIASVFGIHVLRGIPYVMEYGFWGMDVTSGSGSERLVARAINLIMSQEWRVTARGRNAAVFIGELEDVPDRCYGPLV